MARHDRAKKRKLSHKGNEEKYSDEQQPTSARENPSVQAVSEGSSGVPPAGGGAANAPIAAYLTQQLPLGSARYSELLARQETGDMANLHGHQILHGSAASLHSRSVEASLSNSTAAASLLQQRQQQRAMLLAQLLSGDRIPGGISLLGTRSSAASLSHHASAIGSAHPEYARLPQPTQQSSIATPWRQHFQNQQEFNALLLSRLGHLPSALRQSQSMSSPSLLSSQFSVPSLHQLSSTSATFAASSSITDPQYSQSFPSAGTLPPPATSSSTASKQEPSGSVASAAAPAAVAGTNLGRGDTQRPLACTVKGQRYLPLYVPGEDDTTLSRYQILIKQQIEAFEATEEDVQYTESKLIRPVLVGQIGVRCRHCVNLPQYERGSASMYFPRSIVSKAFGKDWLSALAS